MNPHPNPIVDKVSLFLIILKLGNTLFLITTIIIVITLYLNV